MIQGFGHSERYCKRSDLLDAASLLKTQSPPLLSWSGAGGNVKNGSWLPSWLQRYRYLAFQVNIDDNSSSSESGGNPKANHQLRIVMLESRIRSVAHADNPVRLFNAHKLRGQHRIISPSTRSTTLLLRLLYRARYGFNLIMYQALEALDTWRSICWLLTAWTYYQRWGFARVGEGKTKGNGLTWRSEQEVHPWILDLLFPKAAKGKDLEWEVKGRPDWKVTKPNYSLIRW